MGIRHKEVVTAVLILERDEHSPATSEIENNTVTYAELLRGAKIGAGSIVRGLMEVDVLCANGDVIAASPKDVYLPYPQLTSGYFDENPFKRRYSPSKKMAISNN